jgi:peroxiredoxin
MKWRSLEEPAPASETRSLRDTYAERKALIAKYVPTDIQAVHTRAVAELQESGIAERALKPGSEAPEFELLDQNGKLIRSSDLIIRGPLVICFIRGRWCPFCVGQMEAMNAINPRMQELGASLVAISPQTVHQNYLMADQHKLRFPLLSDAGNKVAKQFGLAYRVPEYQQEVYGRAFVNLPFVNGDSSWELAIPATYIIGRQRSAGDGARAPQVLYASASPDYTDRREPSESFSFLHSFPPE